MSDNKKIFGYLDFCINRLVSQSEQTDGNSSVTSDVHSKIHFLKNIKEAIQFQLKTDLEKQTFRRGWVKSLEKRDKPIGLQLATIDLYDRLIEIIELVKESRVKSETFISMCEEEKDLINYTYLSFGKRHIDQKRVFEEISNLINIVNNDGKQKPILLSRLQDLQSSFDKVYRLKSQ